jgi:hypothetical protein
MPTRSLTQRTKTSSSGFAVRQSVKSQRMYIRFLWVRLGFHFPLTKFATPSIKMRLCLTEPRWEEVYICNTAEEIRTGEGVSRMCGTMAEDEGYVLVFDPVEEAYHLAWRSEHGVGTWGVRGDAVGCFLAR